MSSLHSRGVQMIPGKIKLKKYIKIRKVTKNVRNPHILRTLPILHFVDALNFFFWTSYVMDIVIMSSIHLRDVEMMFGKIKLKKYLKIRKGTKNMRYPHILRTLPIFHFFDTLEIF